jgi:hypothetical protein
MDRGCSKLREEIMLLCLNEPECMPHMLKWISRNFPLIGCREREGFDVKTGEGFSLFNRTKLCSFHFHEHAARQTHRKHEVCVIKFNDCSHPGDDKREEDMMAEAIKEMLLKK